MLSGEKLRTAALLFLIFSRSVITLLKKNMHRLYIGILLIFLFGCTTKNSNTSENNIPGADTIKNYDAKGFIIENYSHFKVITLLNPWDAHIPLGKYLLINENQELPHTHPEVDKIIRTPVKHVAALSTTHIGMLHQLGLDASIIGVTDPFRVNNPLVRSGLEKKEIHNLGGSMNVDIEKLIALSPDAIFKSGFAQVKQKDKQILQSGLPVVYISEWQEITPIARAEWLKVFGAFYEKEDFADSLFNAIRMRYELISKKANNIRVKPKVLAGYNFKGTWYMPGGQSYMARLIADAGGDYFWKDDNSTGSIPLGFETVMEKSQHADYWLGVEENTFEELLANDKRIKVFKPFIERHIYHRNKLRTPEGGNDYWESGIVRPDIVLSDFIKIIHPEILPEYETTYYDLLQ